MSGDANRPPRVRAARPDGAPPRNPRSPPGAASAAPMRDDDGERLAKRVAALRGCSRRDAEMLIAQGAVRIDGLPAVAPQQRVTPSQQVEVDEQAQPRPLPPATLLWHKPAGARADAQDWAVDQRVDAHPQAPTAPGLFMQQHCAAALGDAASGLVVHTQVRGVWRRLVDEAGLVEHEFLAEVQGEPQPAQLAALRPAAASLARQGGGTTGLRLVIGGADAHRIAELCDRAGLRLVGLRRLRIGRVPLAGLAPGQWRLLRASERF
ncbi:23S rRNA pseudouridine2604 synthase [Pseudacidovorax sp. RU35E]|nr:23S rRNA pseudouridine2604 synthase [Pseudacidovorax sp. RU35E]